MDAQATVFEIVDALGAMDPDRLRVSWDKDRTVEEWKEIAGFAIIEIGNVRGVLEELVADDLRNALNDVDYLVSGEHAKEDFYSLDDRIVSIERARAKAS